MQIHEMFQRKKITEVDLAGPSSIFNVGREALKDPKAWVSSNALSAAKQRSIDQYARTHAPAVTKAVQSNVAPLAKQLAQGWRQIGAQLPAPITAPTTVPSTPTPTTTTTPASTSANLSTLRQQKPGQPTPADYERLEKRIQQAQQSRPVTEDAAGDYRTAFINYARKVLGARGVDTEAIGNDPATNQALNRVISQITATHNDPDKQQLAVEKYFTTALNKWNEIQQDPVKYNQAFAGRQAPARASTGASVRSGEADQDLKEILNKLGITGAQLSGLTKYAIEANKGSPDFRATGNPIWDAVLKTSGMRPK